ncbi:MAG: hypothetical protein AVDCRST_MAG02-1985 [uncultured Rubrobacteraceae bacterium]|uniref:Tn3 transposase DDE domain-containing protein n=1 Tax=uncultured Rubrobacteraceae bacterium TaxID=349277 RepID=A0A6J4QZ15_9ACTN|nr:MAG: hypothetical protein AVDCRST_MAG02-1985 [uncultured Rubrobacteraceae bacterium]
MILRNTVRYREALAALRVERYPVGDEDLARLSPARYAHVCPYGRYRFDLGGDPARTTSPGPEEAEPR